MTSTLARPELHLPSHESISRRAYEIWEARGCPTGDGSQDWETAKAQLISEAQTENDHQRNGEPQRNPAPQRERGPLLVFFDRLLRKG